MQKSETEIFESPQSVLYNFEHIFKSVFSSPLIEMFYCETSIERVSHKARFNINGRRLVLKKTVFLRGRVR